MFGLFLIIGIPENIPLAIWALGPATKTFHYILRSHFEGSIRFNKPPEGGEER